MEVLLLSPQKCLAGASLAILQPQPFCLTLGKLCHSIPGAFPHILLPFLLPLLSPSRSPRGLTSGAGVYGRVWLLEVCPAQESCQTPSSFSWMKNYRAPPAQKVGKRGDAELGWRAPNCPSFHVVTEEEEHDRQWCSQRFFCLNSITKMLQSVLL